jgi:uncharacterized protein HemX
MQTVNPEMRDIQQQVVDLRERLSKAEGEIQQINRSSSAVAQQTIWQFVIFTVTMGGILIGMLNYQTTSIRNELHSFRNEVTTRFDATDQRIIQLEKRLDQRIDSLEKRMDSLENRIDLMARSIEDLRKEVRNRR